MSICESNSSDDGSYKQIACFGMNFLYSILSPILVNICDF